jgi:glycosyltransferase involved in cell wall biosynthesis
MLPNEKPLISIVMAAYNGAAFIAEQIESIQAQTYTHWELIIGDDASTDQTTEIIRDLMKKDARIRLYVNPQNMGVNRNFEKAISMAAGSFIAISDQDDVWRNDKLDILLSLFTDDQVVLTHAPSIRFREHLPTTIRHYDARIPLTGQHPERCLFFNTIAGHQVLFRKSILSENAAIPDGIFYDWWLVMRASTLGKIRASRDVLTYHRAHQQNVTLGKNDEKKQTRAKANERLRALSLFIGQNDLPSEARQLANQLKSKLATLETRRFSISLFFFLLKHRATLFYFKKNNFLFVSRLKMSYRMSWAI